MTTGPLWEWFWFYADPPQLDSEQLNARVQQARESADAYQLFLLSEVTSTRGVPELKNRTLSKELLEESSNLGHSGAKATLGLKLLFAQSPYNEPGGQDRGAKLLREATETGDSIALLHIGIAHLNELHTFARDLNAAQAAFERSLASGNLRAHYFLSITLHAKGEHSISRMHLEIGARAGDPQAKNGLALLLWNEHGRRSGNRALNLARDAATYGTPQFQYDLATLLVNAANEAEQTIPGEVDDLLEKAAGAGSIDALYLRGALHANGMMPDSDPRLGKRLIRSAAEAGHSLAKQQVRGEKED